MSPFQIENLREVFQRVPIVTTHYSGTGSFEALMAYMAKQFGAPPPRCLHASDTNPASREFLLRHIGGNIAGHGSPEHVFGDFTNRFSKKAVAKLATS